MAGRDLILSFDVGTTGLKASLFSADGRLVASAVDYYPTSYPHPGWAEQNPAQWLEALRVAWKKLWANAPPDVHRRVASVGISGHMMGVVAVNDQGDVLRPAIIHSDVRATPLCERFTQHLSANEFYQITGQPADPHYTVFKLMWLALEQPHVYQSTAVFIQSKDWLRGQITVPVNGFSKWHITDFSDASIYGAFDVTRECWSDEVLEAAGLTKNKLPEVVGSAEVVGGLAEPWASQFGLPSGLPVVAGGGDGACATAGAGVAEPGAAYAYLGGTAWIAELSDGVPLDACRRLFVVGHLEPGIYGAFGTAQTVGSAFDWAAREICYGVGGQPAEWSQVEDMAAQAQPGCRGLFFLPYMMGERSPVWDPHARGAWVGLTLCHTRAELLRSVYEGTSFALRSILEAVEDAAGTIRSLRLIGGGAQSRLWMPILASVLDKELVPCQYLEEATSLGAAMAAGIGVGLFANFREAAKIVDTASPWQPDATLSEMYTASYRRWQELYPALRHFFSHSNM